jgi:leucine-rich repeat protein SHOC2
VNNEELELIIKKAEIYENKTLRFLDKQLTSLPENIGFLSNLKNLYLWGNQLTNLPDSISNLINLSTLDLSCNHFTHIPDSICNLTNLSILNMSQNLVTTLPSNFASISNLAELDLNENPIGDLSILQDLPKLEWVRFLDTLLPRKYWTKLSEWKSEWILEEDNVTIKHILIQQIGYERIHHELNTMKLDNWREYTLLEIDDIDRVYVREIAEPIVLLKMTCPSTGYIHILRVPPDMTSAEAAITWVNHGIHPDEFVVQT